MSGKPLSTRTDERTHSAVDCLSADRDVTKSAAVEAALQAGLCHLGYLGGGRTRAQRLLDHVAVGVFHVGATLVLLSLLGSLSLLVAGVATLAGSLAAVGISRAVIPRFEPGASAAIPRVEVGR
jgi:hypothetical protein